MKHLLLTIITQLFAIALIAQTPDVNTLVVGQINNRSTLHKEIELQLNVRYITSETEKYLSPISPSGQFSFHINVREPQYATLIFNRQKKIIYVEPNDTLSIEFNGGSFPNRVVFGSKGGYNNEFLQQYLSRNPRELNQFKKVQFRKDIFWYSTMPKVDNEMRNTTPDKYKHQLKTKKDLAFSRLDQYRKNNPDKLSADFIHFMETEFMYEWAYNRLMFGHLYQGRYGLEEDYFDFMDELSGSGGSIGNHFYRNYLLASLNYKYGKDKKGVNAYAGQYDLAKEDLLDKPKVFAQSEMLYKAFSSKEPEKILSRYWSFIDNTEYPEYAEKINAAYQKAMRYAEGSPAPDFTLTDKEGQIVSLSQYRGKVIYLNFWASWCRPCVGKMNRLKPLVKELKDSNIVFLNVSLDRQEQNWKSAINSINFGGVHVMADGDIESDIAQKYEVKVLPQYFIIDKYGGFAPRPISNDVASIKEVLLKQAGR